MYFKQFYDKKLAQYAYLIGCQATGEAIVIDPMRDVDQYHALAESEGLNIVAATDTHIHADYVSGLREFAEQGIEIYASDEGGSNWKYEWLIGSSYDYKLLKDGDSFSIGNIRFDVIHTPGHTPESLSYVVTDSAATDEPMGILTGDFVFVGDVGRPDLLETAAGQQGAMKPAAKDLFHSVEAFKNMPEHLQVWPAHGAGSACGKALGAVPSSTVGYELRYSAAFKAAASEESFVDFILEGQPEPPLYFGRMKQVNKEGPEVLGSAERPPHLSLQEIISQDGIIVDTRERHAFMKKHIPGSLLASFDHNFSTTAGSYIDPDQKIYLIIDSADLDQAVRDLNRVGLANIKGYVPISAMIAYTGKTENTIPIDFETVEKQREDKDKVVLDVRKATEFKEGHIPGAINMAHTRLPEQLDTLPADKKLLVHCGTGLRASYAAALLARNGFNVRWVDDSFSHWQKRPTPHP